MTTEYLLPCTCGQATKVSMRQAGDRVQCVCGAQLEVPRMRELRQLEPAPQAAPAETRPTWGRSQGFVFLGSLLAVCSACFALYCYTQMPDTAGYDTPSEQVEKLTPPEAWQYWSVVQHGMPSEPTGDIYDIVMRLEQLRLYIRLSLVLGAAGLLMAIVGRLSRRQPARAPA